MARCGATSILECGRLAAQEPLLLNEMLKCGLRFQSVRVLYVLQFLAYLIIGLSAFLVLGGALFLAVLRIYDRVEEWQVERKNR